VEDGNKLEPPIRLGVPPASVKLVRHRVPANLDRRSQDSFSLNNRAYDDTMETRLLFGSGRIASWRPHTQACISRFQEVTLITTLGSHESKLATQNPATTTTVVIKKRVCYSVQLSYGPRMHRKMSVAPQ
jgi:hypothetical protein